MNPVRVIALIAAYNEEDVIEQVVGDLIAQGVEVYLIDHASTDRTVEAVAAHLGRGLIKVERYPEESGSEGEDIAQSAWWEGILHRKEQLSRELDADWFIHQDADELRESPWDEVSLRDAISRVDDLGYNAIDFRLLDFVPTLEGFQRGDDLRKAFTHFREPADYNRIQVKCWKKLATKVDLASSGGHDVFFAERRVFPVRFLLRHYPIRSQEHGEKKVLRERLPRYSVSLRARGWHVQYNTVTEQTRFAADPDSLREFNPGRIRAELLIENRDFEAARGELDGANRALGVASQRLETAHQELAAVNRRLEALLASTSWQVTAPLRALKDLLNRKGRPFKR